MGLMVCIFPSSSAMTAAKKLLDCVEASMLVSMDDTASLALIQRRERLLVADA